MLVIGLVIGVVIGYLVGYLALLLLLKHEWHVTWDEFVDVWSMVSEAGSYRETTMYLYQDKDLIDVIIFEEKKK